MLVKDLIVGGRFPKQFCDVLPTSCDVCGADTEINASLTILKCSNPYCGCKASQRLLSMLKDIGVKNFGESRCLQFLNHFRITNPYAIFAYSVEEDGLIGNMSQEFCENLEEQVDQHRSMLLWEYVKIGNLPNLRDSARFIFNGYTDLNSFYDDLEDGGVLFIQERLGIKGNEDDLSVRALAIYDSLQMFKDDLLAYIDFVDIISPRTILNICISTAVGNGYSSKADFVSKMNERYGSFVHLNFLSSVTKDCDYVIWSKAGAPTNKVSKARKLGIPILTGMEFEMQIRQFMNSGG